MAKYRDALPQLTGDLFLTDAGAETTLLFLNGFDLPHFAAFHLLKDPAGREAIDAYYRTHAGIARDHGVGFVLESATWRAGPDWGERLGYSPDALAGANRECVEMLHRLRAELETDTTPMVVSGCIGPRGDGYDPGEMMSADEAAAYHATQAHTLADADVDLISFMTACYVDEAIGVARAARAEDGPSVISFTVETDGRLPTGESLGEAVERVDEATDAAPAYYMINCAHPTHFEGALEAGESWVERVRAIRANASRRSHAELDEAEDLDAGDPEELGAQYRALRERFPGINLLGGCCGTDDRHVRAIAAACLR